jgi:hypothetical protein
MLEPFLVLYIRENFLDAPKPEGPFWLLAEYQQGDKTKNN